jgi:hypothetical protein
VRAIAVASDATHGPLIAVLTRSGELMVKEGSLTAPCTPISDPVNGPLIGVQDIEDGSDGRLLVQTGGLDGSWNVENTDVAPGALSLSG